MKLKFGDKKSIEMLKKMEKRWYQQNVEPVDLESEEISFEACGCMSLKRKGWDAPSFVVKELLEEEKLLVWEVKCIYFATCKWKLPARFSYFDEHNSYEICECLCKKEVITDLEGNIVGDLAFNISDDSQMKLHLRDD